jgi:hypothetical protein
MSTQCFAGTGRSEITPPFGLEMCGYGPHLKRKCFEVRDPLFARALLLSDGQERALILTCDLIGLDEPICQAARKAISAEMGISPERIFIACSHTHSGPATMFTIAWGELDNPYINSLPGALLAAAKRADSGLREARIGFRRQRVEGVGRNRVLPEIGLLDPAAQLMRVDDLSGKPIAVVFNFGAHPVVRYPFTWRLSADWPGVCAREIARAFDGAEALFLLGPGGNINGHYVDFARDDVERRHSECDARVEETGLSLFRQIEPAIRELKCEDRLEIRSLSKRVVLPQEWHDPEDLKRYIEANRKLLEETGIKEGRDLRDIQTNEPPEHAKWRGLRFNVDWAAYRLKLIEAKTPCFRSVPVQALKLGSAAFVAWPGEIYVDLGIEVRQRSPIRMTFVASMAGGSIGYVATPAAYESQGRANQFGYYEAINASRLYGHFQYRPNVSRVLIEHTLQMLLELAG